MVTRPLCRSSFEDVLRDNPSSITYEQALRSACQLLHAITCLQKVSD